MTPAPRCDVAVVGGGPAGAATAASLASQGMFTTLVEWADERRFRIGETVPADVEPLLARLGVLDEFLAGGHLPAAGAASAWGSAELAWRDDFLSALGAGWHLRRREFDDLLLRNAGRCGAVIRRGRRVIGARRSDGRGWVLLLRAPHGGVETLEAAFVVDASGRGARLASRFGAVPHIADSLSCVFAVLDVTPTAAANAHTVVESTESGWWYAGRLPGERAVAAYFSDADMLRDRSALRPSSWHELLCQTRHVFGLLGRPSEPAQVRCASARSHRLDHMVGDGWLAVGDAALAWDPLTSAGVMLSLRSALRAGETVGRLQQGDTAAGERYEMELAAAHGRYLAERRAYYSLERRWPASEFWSRRRDDVDWPAPWSSLIDSTHSP